MKLYPFQNKSDLEIKLANTIVELARQAIDLFGDTRLLLSGGSTPFGVYELLAQSDLDWKNVHIGLVDERFVPETDENSNFRNLKKAMQKAIEAGVNLYPMVNDTENRAQNLLKANSNYAPFIERLDVSFLGMGNDGHTASLFPGDQVALDDLTKNELQLIYATSPSHPKHRITCSSGLLRSAAHTFLLFTGADKKAVFDEAKQKNYPIYQLTKDLRNFYVFYC
ncbi:MAG: 6-phosphogluconolactonase [Crocinitomicaceae bacterium]|nr:6-phosphogluconolactonase [Crocinitomicaceae bacterium]